MTDAEKAQGIAAAVWAGQKGLAARGGRVLIGGDWKWPIYEEALASGFRELGWEVFEFRQGAPEDSPESLRAKLHLRSSLRSVNARLVATTARARPDIVFLQRCHLILPETIRAVRKISPGTRVFEFHNDDPFVGLKNRVKLRRFLGSLRHSDATFVFRPVNMEDARRHGASVVEMLLPYYVKALHHPVRGRVVDFDVVFIGHYEPDGRAQMIEALASAGLRVGLFGTGWHDVPRSCSWIRSQTVLPVRGDEYRRTLSRGRMALVFLSKRNRDVWTTRCFEIPACGVAMLAPDNAYMRGLFSEHEAIYYQDGDVPALVEQAVAWARDPERCDRVAQAGWSRCMKDGHSETNRAGQIVGLWARLEDVRAN